MIAQHRLHVVGHQVGALIHPHIEHPERLRGLAEPGDDGIVGVEGGGRRLVVEELPVHAPEVSHDDDREGGGGTQPAKAVSRDGGERRAAQQHDDQEPDRACLKLARVVRQSWRLLRRGE